MNDEELGNSTLERYSSEVKAKIICGKFPVGTPVTKAVTVDYGSYGAFGDRPDLLSLSKIPKNVKKTTSLLSNIAQTARSPWYKDSQLQDKLIHTNFVSICSIDDQDRDMLVGVHFISNVVRLDHREKYILETLSVVMSEQTASAFVKDIKENPDFLESFAQIEFGPVLGAIDRYKASGFIVFEDSEIDSIPDDVSGNFYSKDAENYFSRHHFKTFEYSIPTGNLD